MRTDTFANPLVYSHALSRAHTFSHMLTHTLLHTLTYVAHTYSLAYAHRRSYNPVHTQTRNLAHSLFINSCPNITPISMPCYSIISMMMMKIYGTKCFYSIIYVV